jgi:hypothetical protein
MDRRHRRGGQDRRADHGRLRARPRTNRMPPFCKFINARPRFRAISRRNSHSRHEIKKWENFRNSMPQIKFLRSRSPMAMNSGRLLRGIAEVRRGSSTSFLKVEVCGTDPHGNHRVLAPDGRIGRSDLHGFLCNRWRLHRNETIRRSQTRQDSRWVSRKKAGYQSRKLATDN